MKQSINVGIALSAAAVLALAGCSSTGSDAADQRDSVEIVYSAQPANLDPQLSGDASTVGLTRPVFETLVTVNSKGEAVPQLAERFEQNEDGTSYTFTLREGLQFQDGSDLTADDVIASMERWSTLAPPVQKDFAGATWSKVDDLTVTLDLPSASFLPLLQMSSRFANYPAIMPSEIVEAAGEDPITDIVGTGPYRFEEWVPDQSITLEKWDGYQPASGEPDGLSGDKTPKLEQLNFTFVPDASTRALGIQSGEYDVVTDTPYDALEQIKADPNLQLITYQVSPQNLIYSGRSGSIIEEPAMRQAINAALDRDEIMLASVGSADLYDLVHHNMVKKQENVWNTEVGLAEFNQHDPAVVQRYLDEAGYSGEELVLTVSREYTEAYNAAVVVQDQLKKAGINVKLDTMEWAAYFERFLNDSASWDMSVFPQVPQLDPSQTVGFSDARPAYWPTPEFTALLDRYRSQPTLEDASAMYDDMQSYIEDQRPLSRLGDAHTVLVTKASLGDIPSYNGIIEWWLVDFTD